MPAVQQEGVEFLLGQVAQPRPDPEVHVPGALDSLARARRLGRRAPPQLERRQHAGRRGRTHSWDALERCRVEGGQPAERARARPEDALRHHGRGAGGSPRTHQERDQLPRGQGAHALRAEPLAGPVRRVEESGHGTTMPLRIGRWDARTRPCASFAVSFGRSARPPASERPPHRMERS